MDFITFISVPLFIFFIGLSGVFFNRKNVILVLLSIELLLLAVNLNFLITSSYLGDRVGQVFAIFVMTVAAAESSIGLAILVVYYRLQGTASVELIKLLKG